MSENDSSNNASHVDDKSDDLEIVDGNEDISSENERYNEQNQPNKRIRTEKGSERPIRQRKQVENLGLTEDQVNDDGLFILADINQQGDLENG